jgi:hypothetical protein|tara:strand:- start:43 stop:315 length:273 start_codon:yes stop_codon:yes gene_type:complete
LKYKNISKNKNQQKAKSWKSKISRKQEIQRISKFTENLMKISNFHEIQKIYDFQVSSIFACFLGLWNFLEIPKPLKPNIKPGVVWKLLRR